MSNIAKEIYMFLSDVSLEVLEQSLQTEMFGPHLRETLLRLDVLVKECHITITKEELEEALSRNRR